MVETNLKSPNKNNVDYDINFNKEINNFWNSEVWDIIKQKKLKKNIKNKLLENKFYEFENLGNEQHKANIKFTIDSNNNVFMDNDKKNIKKNIDFKKNNLSILKLHSDCFNRFHDIIFNCLNKKKELGKYDLDIILKHNIIYQNNNNNNNKQGSNQEICFNKNIIEEHLNYFKKKILSKENIENKKYIDNHKLLFDTLEINIQKILKDLENFVNSIIEKNLVNDFSILLIDTENILKSFVIQDFLKSQMEQKQFEKYFFTWNNGCIKDDNKFITIGQDEISLSEYSSKIKYIEPFTSLNLSFKKKKKLVNILTNKLINTNNTINIITNSETNKLSDKEIIDYDINVESTNSNITTHSNNCNSFENLIIPIQYNNKFDIREQDDHLIIFLYTLFEKLNLNPIIISNDKFKWFSDFNELNIKNFKFLYDFDKYEKKIIIDTQYTPDIYKYKNQYFYIPFINYPYLKNDLHINYSLRNSYDEIKNFLKNKLKKIQILDMEKLTNYLFYYSIIELIPDNIYNLIEILDFIIKYLEYISNKFDKIFEFLSSKSKDKIFKLSIGLEDISILNSLNQDKPILEDKVLEKFNKKIINNIQNISTNVLNNYLVLFDNYLALTNIYIILKFILYKYITFKLYSELEINDLVKYKNLFIQKLCIIFDYIIGIYNLTDEHIYKIRKLSISKLEIYELFKKINIIHIYIRKQGFLKKNIFL